MNLPYAMKMTGFSQVALLPILIARFNEAARARKTEKERERERERDRDRDTKWNADN